MHRAHDQNDGLTKLLLRAQGGDTQAFAELYTALSPVVRDFIASLDGKLCRHEAEDLAHEALLSVWRKLPEYRGQASAKTFTLAIAKNITMKHMAKRKKLPLIYTGDLTRVFGGREPCEPAGSLPAEPSETRMVILQAMARLTDGQRRAVEANLSHDSRMTAAQEAHCTPSQFADRLYKARKRLRQMLKGLIRCVLL